VVRGGAEADQGAQRGYRCKPLDAAAGQGIGQLAGGISHDLNNILTPILVCAQTLHEEVKSPEGLYMLGTIESAARRGAEIVSLRCWTLFGTCSGCLCPDKQMFWIADKCSEICQRSRLGQRKLEGRFGPKKP